MGPKDGYIAQFTPETNTFWADPNSLSLGCTFRGATPGTSPPKGYLPTGRFFTTIAEGG